MQTWEPGTAPEQAQALMTARLGITSRTTPDEIEQLLREVL